MASLAPLSANRVLHRNFVYQGQLIGGVELSLALLVGPSPAHQPKASASARPAAGTPPPRLAIDPRGESRQIIDNP
jgi:hypothetical protein